MGIFGLSFDDGRMDNYQIAYPLLCQYELPATFNITTSYIERKPTKWPFTHARAMTMDMVRELHADKKMEIASHGYWHNNDLSNLLEGIRTLCAHLGVDHLHQHGNGISLTGDRSFTFDIDAARNDLQSADVCYVRRAVRLITHPLLRTVARKANRVIALPPLMRFAFGNTLMTEADGMTLYSIPVVGTMPSYVLKTMADLAFQRDAACILMLHSVVRDGEMRDLYSIEEKKLKALCEHLCELRDHGKIEIATTMDIFEKLSGRGNR
mgnify:CR=1 FL=1